MTPDNFDDCLRREAARMKLAESELVQFPSDARRKLGRLRTPFVLTCVLLLGLAAGVWSQVYRTDSDVKLEASSRSDRDSTQEASPTGVQIGGIKPAMGIDDASWLITEADTGEAIGMISFFSDGVFIAEDDCKSVVGGYITGENYVQLGGVRSRLIKCHSYMDEIVTGLRYEVEDGEVKSGEIGRQVILTLSASPIGHAPQSIASNQPEPN